MAMAAASAGTTVKGAAQADAIAEAAVSCLGRDGFAATSLQTVADEAGVTKRSVVYYFGSRTGLMSAVVDRIGDRFVGALEEALRDLDDPAKVLTTGIERTYELLAEDRALQAAYFGLVAESVTDPEIRARLAPVRARARQLGEDVLDEIEAAGYEIVIDRESLVLLLLALAQGLGLELLESGESPELERAVGLTELAAQFAFQRRQ